MAEQYLPPEETPFVPPCPQDNVIRVDFQPALDRPAVMRLIGMKAVIGWQPDLHAEVLSSEPMHIHEDENGNIDVTFKQYHKNYATDSSGIPHTYGWSGGTETIRILNIHWDANSHSINSDYVHARNFRYQLVEFESQKRHEYINQERKGLSDELWGVSDA